MLFSEGKISLIVFTVGNTLYIEMYEVNGNENE